MLKEFKLGELAHMLQVELRGDPNSVISGINTLSKATPSHVSFLSNSRYRHMLNKTKAGAVILSFNDLDHCHVNALVTKNPYLAYAKAAALFHKSTAVNAGIHPSAVIEQGCQIHPSATIGPHAVIQSGTVIEENVVIGPGCSIGADCRIGSGSCFYPNVTIYHDVQIGKRVIIHSSAVIGSDGFGYAKDGYVWHKIPQIGSVQIHDDVEIGSNTTIDRGALDDTIIEEGVKLDNQIQIGHNVRIGAHTAIAGCVGIAGSTTIGKRCAIGGGVGIIGHLTITDDVYITAGSGIGKSIERAGVYSSSIDAQPATIWKKTLVRIHQLDAMSRKVRDLEKKLVELQSTLK